MPYNEHLSFFSLMSSLSFTATSEPCAEKGQEANQCFQMMQV